MGRIPWLVVQTDAHAGFASLLDAGNVVRGTSTIIAPETGCGLHQKWTSFNHQIKGTTFGAVDSFKCSGAALIFEVVLYRSLFFCVWWRTKDSL